MSSFARWSSVGASVVLALLAAACGPAPLSNSTVYSPPPPLAMVAIVDPASDRMPTEIHQLEDVIRSNADPGEAVVVMFVQPSFGQRYVVRAGDSLSSIAAAHGLTLSAVEAANPQFGPLGGRDWKLIHPNEQLTLPNGAAQDPLLLVSKAPSGPPPPELMRLPSAPRNPTDFQKAEYARNLAAAKATNDARIAAWRAAAAASVKTWQDQVIQQLDQKASAQPAPVGQSNSAMLSASLTAGATTLHGLQGRRLLLVLGGGDSGPDALQPHSLLGVNLIVANLSDSKSADAWASAATSAGATSVSALDDALTQLQLAQLVNQ